MSQKYIKNWKTKIPETLNVHHIFVIALCILIIDIVFFNIHTNTHVLYTKASLRILFSK